MSSREQQELDSYEYRNQQEAERFDTDTQPAAPSPTAWRHSDHPDGGQLLSGEHGPIGTVFTVRDAALIVRAVNEREELICNLKAAIAYLEDDSRSERRRQACLASFRAVLAKTSGD